MAAGVLRTHLPALSIASAGTRALIGAAADPLAVRLMAARGIDLSSHRAVQITRMACADSDLILAMDSAQINLIKTNFPELQGRVFRLGEYLDRDIPDPYRESEAAFRHSLALIEESVQQWLQRIRRIRSSA